MFLISRFVTFIKVMQARGSTKDKHFSLGHKLHSYVNPKRRHFLPNIVRCVVECKHMTNKNKNSLMKVEQGHLTQHTLHDHLNIAHAKSET